MRTFTAVLASSVRFTANGTAFSTSAAATTGQFGPGATGGPTKLEFGRGFTLQGNFGGIYPAATFNCLVSNVPEKPMFVVAASAFVGSTGSVMFNAANSNYLYVDWQVIPATTASSGFVTVILQEKQGGA